MCKYSFEKLSVWFEAKELTKLIYLLVKKFPDDEKIGVSSQLKRASISICSNIAKGFLRKTNKDKAHYTAMAFSSAAEVLNQIIIYYELEFITETEYLILEKRLKVLPIN